MYKTNKLLFILSTLAALLCGMGAVADAPGLREVFDIHAKCGRAIVAGDIPGGKRVMIPITGGEVSGELKARIIPGGADYQMVDTLCGRVEYKAVYTLLTEDSTYINVTNLGVSSNAGGKNYFVTSPKFEADVNSPYGWLNDRIFVCRPVRFEPDGIVLRVWVVE